jgi:hypothetical protein
MAIPPAPGALADRRLTRLPARMATLTPRAARPRSPFPCPGPN